MFFSVLHYVVSTDPVCEAWFIHLRLRKEKATWGGGSLTVLHSDVLSGVTGSWGWNRGLNPGEPQGGDGGSFTSVIAGSESHRQAHGCPQEIKLTG